MPQLQLVMEVCNLDHTDFIQFWPMHDNLLYVTRVDRDPDWFAAALPVFRNFTMVLRHLRANRHLLEGLAHPEVYVRGLLLGGGVVTPYVDELLLVERDDDRRDATVETNHQLLCDAGAGDEVGVGVGLEVLLGEYV
jgi:hypothetical protein